MRRVVVPAIVAVILALSASGCNSGCDEMKLSARGNRTFNSELSLKVCVVRDIDGLPEEIVIGRTPSAEPVVIPKCTSWFVRPDNLLGMPALAREIATKRIPGLILHKADDRDMESLKGLTELRELRLDGEEITDAGLLYLKGLTGLRVLHLYGRRFTDAGLMHIRGMTKLRELDLSDTKITDAGLVHLKGLTELQELNLFSTYGITGAGLVLCHI
jgi:hypothetical protein